MKPKRKADPAALSVAERVLLFGVASGTVWQKAGVSERTALLVLVKRMIERGSSGELSLTEHGHQALRQIRGRFYPSAVLCRPWRNKASVSVGIGAVPPHQEHLNPSTRLRTEASGCRSIVRMSIARLVRHPGQ